MEAISLESGLSFQGEEEFWNLVVGTHHFKEVLEGNVNSKTINIKMAEYLFPVCDRVTNQEKDNRLM